MTWHGSLSRNSLCLSPHAEHHAEHAVLMLSAMLPAMLSAMLSAKRAVPRCRLRLMLADVEFVARSNFELPGRVRLTFLQRFIPERNTSRGGSYR